MTRILFVCHGNICHSPMAEFVMKDMVKKTGHGAEFDIAYAGTSAEEPGNPVYPPARAKLLEHGVDPAGKTARRLRRDDYGKYDYLIGMDSANYRNMCDICNGDPQKKISLLLEFTGLSRDISDPWYTGGYEQTWQDVNLGCEALMHKILEG